jgi:two-component system, NarL family, nitrate/nitrite response regulator NarL
MADIDGAVIADSRSPSGALAAVSTFLLAAMRSGRSGAMLVFMALRCLIVDDNSSFLDAARVLLVREGVDVAGVATTSAEALRRVEELAPDVVLVDIVLGNESGFDLARRLQTAGATVVLISTHDQADIEDLLEGSAAAGFVPKSELSARALHRVLAGAADGP